MYDDMAYVQFRTQEGKNAFLQMKKEYDSIASGVRENLRDWENRDLLPAPEMQKWKIEMERELFSLHERALVVAAAIDTKYFLADKRVRFDIDEPIMGGLN